VLIFYQYPRDVLVLNTGDEIIYISNVEKAYRVKTGKEI